MHTTDGAATNSTTKQEICNEIDELMDRIKDEYGKGGIVHMAAKVLFRLAAQQKQEEEMDNNG